MNKCMWCNGDTVTPPNAADYWLVETYNYCPKCNELVPKN